MIFFQCAPLIHHAGHISFWGHRLVGLAVAPRMPRNPSWRVILGVMARWSAKAGGHGVHYALAVPPVGRGSQGRRLVGGNVRVRASRVAVIVDGERAEAAACACRPGVEPHRRR